MATRGINLQIALFFVSCYTVVAKYKNSAMGYQHQSSEFACIWSHNALKCQFWFLVFICTCMLFVGMATKCMS